MDNLFPNGEASDAGVENSYWSVIHRAKKSISIEMLNVFLKNSEVFLDQR